jgi:poly(3-hydroxybutyrate) depolymerase
MQASAGTGFAAVTSSVAVGTPATIAELTRNLVKTHGLDEHRVYAAGLSAGGAMAAVLAST